MDLRLLAQLFQAGVPVVAVLALVLALRSRPRVSVVEALRARAQWLTVAVAVVGLYLAVVTVVRAVEQNPLGILVFLALCAYAGAGGLVVASAWRRHREAVRQEQLPIIRADPDPSGPHRSLGGDGEPPRRW